MNEATESKPTFERWLPVEDVPATFGGYSLRDERTGLSIRLHTDDRDLVLSFPARSILAYRVHGEFCHPRFHQEPPVPPSEVWPWGTEPLLIVRESQWLHSFSDSQIHDFQHPTHYFIYTLDDTIDILSLSEPQAQWEPTEFIAK
jgi:hypothetical protein